MTDMVPEIGIAVHLGFSFPENPSHRLHPRQWELLKRWKEYTESLMRKGGILLYVPLPRRSLNTSFLASSILPFPNRFIPISLSPFKNTDFIQVLKMHDYNYDPDCTKLVPFGELRELSVSAYGQQIKESLTISDAHYISPSSQLSLGCEEFEEIKEWGKYTQRV